MPVNALICSCTRPDALTAERLAACVNLLPALQSIYRWQGAAERVEEVLLLIKTMPEHFDRLRDRLRELHPHELPELLAVETAVGLPEYIGWIAEDTRRQD